MVFLKWHVSERHDRYETPVQCCADDCEAKEGGPRANDRRCVCHSEPGRISLAEVLPQSIIYIAIRKDDKTGGFPRWPKKSNLL